MNGPRIVMDTLMPGYIIHAHPGGVTSVSFSPEGLLLATSGYDSMIRIWNTATWAELFAFKGHRRGHVAFTHDGRQLISVGVHADGCSFDTSTWQLLETITGGENAWGLAAVPNTNMAAIIDPPDEVTDHCSILLVDTSLLFLANVLDTDHLKIGKMIYSLAFAPNGSRVAVSHSPDGVVTILSGDFAQRIKQWPAHNLATWATAFSPDGSLLVTGGADNFVRLWDAGSWELLQEYRHDEPGASTESGVLCAAFSPDGRLLISGGLNGKVAIRQIVGLQESPISITT